MRLKFVAVSAVLLVGAFAGEAVTGTRPAPIESDPLCEAPDARILVDLTKHVLALCDKSVVVASFAVRLGRGGVGKTREGDGKTPVGTYPLGAPRPSKRYGIFIPIDFPTEEQKKKGYTGSAVGVHGPPRWARWLGSAVNTFDLSDGCVGLARDAEMDEIANWVRATSTPTIELR